MVNASKRAFLKLLGVSAAALLLYLALGKNIPSQSKRASSDSKEFKGDGTVRVEGDTLVVG